MRTYTARRISIIALVMASVFNIGSASAFTLQDDPSSMWDPPTGSSIAVNVITYTGIKATNLTGNSLPELKFTIPFIWPRFDNVFTGDVVFQPMDWSNDKNGWFTDNFLGSSLTVQLSNPGVSFERMENIADIGGLKPLPLTAPCADPALSPSCQQVSFPSETRKPTDMIPVFSLGSFEANQSKSFDVAFTYTWGDNRPGPMRTAVVGYTLSAPVPEPETYLLVSVGLLGIFLRSRSRVRRV